MFMQILPTNIMRNNHIGNSDENVHADIGIKGSIKANSENDRVKLLLNEHKLIAGITQLAQMQDDKTQHTLTT